MAVVGCGYAGVELAATVAERLQDGGIVQAINVDTTICPTAPPGNREAALKVSCLEFGFHVSWKIILCITEQQLQSNPFSCINRWIYLFIEFSNANLVKCLVLGIWNPTPKSPSFSMWLNFFLSSLLQSRFCCSSPSKFQFLLQPSHYNHWEPFFWLLVLGSFI